MNSEHAIVFDDQQVLAIDRGEKTEVRHGVMFNNSTVLGQTSRELWEHLLWGENFSKNVRVDRGPNMLHPEPGAYLHVPATNPKDQQPPESFNDLCAIYRVRPRWLIGDRLWVRESAWQYESPNTLEQRMYFRDGFCVDRNEQRAKVCDEFIGGNWDNQRRAEFFDSLPLYDKRAGGAFPKWAARRWLVITDIRAQRIQYMTPAEMAAEGSYLGKCSCMAKSRSRTAIDASFRLDWCHIHGREFSKRWNHTNRHKRMRYESNPWAWVFVFKLEQCHGRRVENGKVVGA